MDPIFLGLLCLGFLVYLVQHPLLALPFLALFLAALYHQDRVVEWLRELQRARSQALATVHQVQERYDQLTKEEEQEKAKRERARIAEEEEKASSNPVPTEEPEFDPHPAAVQRQTTLQEIAEFLPDFSDDELRKKLSLSYFANQDPSREQSSHPGNVPSSVSCDQKLCNTTAPIAAVEDPELSPETSEEDNSFFRRSRSLDFRELFSSRRRSKKAHSVQSPERPATLYCPFGPDRDEANESPEKPNFRHSWENRRSSLRRRLSAKRNSSSSGANSRRRSSLMMVREEGTPSTEKATPITQTPIRNSMGGSFQDLPKSVGSDRLSIELGGSPSRILSGSSTTSRIKSRMKAAISGKLKSAGSAYSLVSNKADEEKGTPAPLSPIPSLASPHGSDNTPRLRTKGAVEWDRLLENCLRYLREVVRTGKVEMVGGSASAVLDVVLQFLNFISKSGALAPSSPSRSPNTAKPRGTESQVSERWTRLHKKTIALLKWADDTMDRDMISRQLGQEKKNVETELSLLDGLSSELKEALMDLLSLNREISGKSGRESTASNRISTDSGTVVSMGSEEDASLPEESTSWERMNPPPKPPHPSQQLASQRARTESPPALPPRKTPSGTPGAGRRASPPASGDSGILIDAQLGSTSQTSILNGDDFRLFSDKSMDNILGRLSFVQGGIGTESGSSPLKEIDFIDGSICVSPDVDDKTPIISAKRKEDSVSSQKESKDVQVVEESEDTVDGKRVKTTRIRTTRQMVTRRTTNQEHVISARTLVPTENLSPELLKMLRESPNGEIKITQRQEANIRKEDHRRHEQKICNATSPPPLTDASNTVSFYDNCARGSSSSQGNVFDDNGGWQNLPTPPPVPKLRDTLEPLEISEDDQVFSDYDNNVSTPESSPDHKPSQLRTPKPLPRQSLDTGRSDSEPISTIQRLPPSLPPKNSAPSKAGTTKRERRSEKFISQSSSLQSFNRQTIVNGKVVEKDAGNSWDTRNLKMHKSATFENGACIGTDASGSYDEDGCSTRHREMAPTDAPAGNNAASNPRNDSKQNKPPLSSAPPLPPKNRHVVTYMQIFRPPSVEIKEQSEDAALNMKSSALASYVVLRDRLCQHEQAQKQRHFSFAASTSGGGGGRDGNFFSRASMGPTNFGMDFPSGPSASFDFGDSIGNEYRNLVSSWKDTERIQFPKKYPLPEPPPTGKSPASSPNSKRRLALPVASILGALDASDWLLMKKSPDSKDEVRGGCPDALIVYSTQPGAHIFLYQEAFLITYRTFVDPLDLIRRLIWRYSHLNSEAEEDAAKRKAARNTFCLIVRIVDTLCSTEVNSEMMAEVNTFGYRLVEDGDITLALLLRRKALERIEAKNGPAPIIPLSPHKTRNSKVENSRSSLSEFKSELIAEQLCALDSEFFQKIDVRTFCTPQLSEMLLWSQEQNEEKSPNLVIFTEHFNKMSFWVRTRVLEPPEHKEREKIFAKFIKIMKVLRRFGNFNSYLAILSALDSGPVRRLEWSRSITEGLAEHSGIMNSSQSFKNYRSALAETKPPCVPYIGLILQDLTFVHIGSPNILSAEMVGGRPDVLNFTKRWQQFTILDSVRRFKSWAYPFKKEERIMTFFGDFDDYMSEDAIWELSESIKPRGGRQLF